MLAHSFTLILRSSRWISPSVKHFQFTPAEGKVISFIAGQFIRVTIPSSSEKPVNRSYSIANTGEQQNCLEFAASYVPQGLASEFLFAMQAGDSLEATGPFGRLILPPMPEESAPSNPLGQPTGQSEPVQRYILVATGTGVTPYRSMLPELARRMAIDKQLEVILLLGVRTQEDALYQEEFVSFSKEHSCFQLGIYYSRAQAPFNLECEFQGHVSKAFDTISVQPDSDIVYLCGNPNMIDDLFKYLTEQGLNSRRIRREKYI